MPPTCSPAGFAPSASRRLIAALLLGLASACQPASDGDPALSSSSADAVAERLELAPVDDFLGYREPVLLWQWSAETENAADAYRVESGKARWIERGGRRALLLDRSAEKLQLRFPLQLRAGGAWVLEVDAQIAASKVPVWASIQRQDGKRSLARQDLVGGLESTVVSIELGQHKAQRNRLVELTLGVEQGDDPLVLRGLTLRRAAPDLELGPETFGRYGLTALEDDFLRATALRSGEPMFSYARPTDERAVLQFHYGIPRVIDPETPGRTLRVRAEGESSGKAIQADFEMPETGFDEWLQGQLPIGQFAGETVYVQFEYAASGENDLLALGQPRCSVPMQRPATVVLVTSDTHRADHVGFRMTPDRLRTEAIDRLAARGVAFMDVTSSANNTTPSHVSLLTGLSPLETKLISNGTRLADAAPTLAEAFADNGFVTLASVSALPVFHQVTNLGQGFDRYSNPANGSLRDGSESLDALLKDLDDYADQPVFAWLHVYDAHAPYTPPEEMTRLYYSSDLDPFDPDASNARPDLAPAWDRKIFDPEYTEALYRSEVTYVDGILDRLLAVERVGAGLFALTSDHGEVLSRGSDKLFDHDGISWNTLRVPLIFAGEGVPEGQQRSDEARQIDTGRTLLNLAKLDHVAFPGRDLFKSSSASSEARFAIEANGFGASILKGRYFLRIKLRLDELEPKADLHQVQLFDRIADPDGEHDLVEERPEVSRRLRRELVDWLVAASDTNYSEVTSGNQAEVARQLAELGYSSTGTMAAKTWIDTDCQCEWCQRFD